MILRRNLFLYIIAAFVVSTGCSNSKIDPLNPWNIADEDSVYLTPIKGGELHKVPGILFKAIDTRFIANVYGYNFVVSSGYLGVRKEFKLISFDDYGIPNYDDPSPLTSLNVRKKWNYYVNDYLLYEYSRVLISAFMLQSFEKVEYIPSDSTEWLFAKMMPLGIDPKDLQPNQYSHEQISRDGSIRVYIRDISKSKIDDKTTIYLIDNKVVTRKIYEALNPVFIRSLKRVTDKLELMKYTQKKNIKEVVDVELFTYDNDLNNNNISNGGIWYTIRECRDCDAYIVDNVHVDWKIYEALRNTFFKECRYIYEEKKEEFEPYRKLFPDKDFGGWSKSVTIVSL